MGHSRTGYSPWSLGTTSRFHAARGWSEFYPVLRDARFELFPGDENFIKIFRWPCYFCQGWILAPAATDPLIREMLLELKNERPAGYKFFFYHKGKMLRYPMIREELNKALIQSGYGEYSGTHILRHSMGSFSRKEAGFLTLQRDKQRAMPDWM